MYKLFWLLLLVLCALVVSAKHYRPHFKRFSDVMVNSFLVKLEEGVSADEVARDNLCNKSMVLPLPHWYLFSSHYSSKFGNHSYLLYSDWRVLEYFPLVNRSLEKRYINYTYNDPDGITSWHLGYNDTSHGNRILDVWALGYTGKNVIIQVVDEGVDYTHPEISNRFILNYSWNYVTQSNNPSPNEPTDDHGNACMGLAGGSRNNSLCSSGVAPGASLCAINLLGAVTTSLIISDSFTKFDSTISISSNSWGDPGLEAYYATYDSFVYETFQSQTADTSTAGRHGLGILYLFASGNDRLSERDTNNEELQTVPFVISVGAVGPPGQYTEYSTPGTSLWVTASSLYLDQEPTGMRTISYDGQCNTQFSGTSAATPVTSGCFALLLEANPRLTYRDVMYLLVQNSDVTDLSDIYWTTNSAGFNHSRDYGFGILNCLKLVTAATSPTWLTACPLLTNTQQNSSITSPLPLNYNIPVTSSITITDTGCTEHVMVYLNIDHIYAPELEISLTSPSGTVSMLQTGHPRPPYLYCPGYEDAPMPLTLLSNQSLVNLKNPLVSRPLMYISTYDCVTPVNPTTDSTVTFSKNYFYVFDVAVMNYANTVFGRGCTVQRAVTSFISLGLDVLIIWGDRITNTPVVSVNSTIPTYTFAPLHPHNIYYYDNQTGSDCGLYYTGWNIVSGSSQSFYSIPSWFRMTSLSFWGELPQGRWTLSVTDMYDGNPGYHLNGWMIHIHRTNSTAQPITPPNIIHVVCGNSVSPTITGYPNGSICTPNLLSYKDTNNTSICPYTLTRTWTYKDRCGSDNTTATQKIILDDHIPPTIIMPSNITIQCNTSTTPSHTGMASATDNCSSKVTITHSDSVQPGPCGYTQTIYRTWTATDPCGNSVNAVQVIHVADTVPPKIFPPGNLILQCNDSKNNTGIAVGTDNCGKVNVTYTDHVVVGFCSANYVIQRNWTVSDGCNVVSSVQNISVVDTIAPILTIPPNINLSCNGSLGTDNAGNANATDFCSNVNVNFVDHQYGNVINRTWTAVDTCKNSHSAVQVIVVDDILPPIVLTPNATVSLECNATRLPNATGNPTIVDQCTNNVAVTFNDVQINGSCPQNFTINRNWEVDDHFGNVYTWTQLLRVYDTISPSLSVPRSLTVECNSSLLPSVTGQANVSDNCDSGVGRNLTYKDTKISEVNCHTVVLRSWMAVDSCGNSINGSQQINIVDSTVPVLVVPKNVTFQCSLNTTYNTLPNKTGYPNVTDACDKNINVSFVDNTTIGDCGLGFTLRRVWKAVDSCQNAVTSIQILKTVDTIAPTISSLMPITTMCNSPLILPPPIVSDNCDTHPSVNFTDRKILGHCSGSYIIERTWIAWDKCGNNVTAVQNIAANDTLAPVATFPSNITVDCDESISPNRTGTVTNITDNCDNKTVVTYQDSSVVVSCDTITTRMWTVSDDCGNTVQNVQTIWSSDTTGPIFDVPDITITCPQQTIPSITGDPSNIKDSCSSSGFIVSYKDDTSMMSTGLCPVGTLIRTWTVKDACGNPTQLKQQIFVLAAPSNGNSVNPNLLCWTLVLIVAKWCF